MGRIMDLYSLQKELYEERSKGKTIVFTNGCFDAFHEGHMYLLKEAKKLGDVLVVAVNSDLSVKALKGPGRPRDDETTRLLNVSINGADYVCLFEALTPLLVVQQIKPDVLVKGNDYDPDQVVGRAHAGKVVLIERLPGFSTSLMLGDINEGE